MSDPKQFADMTPKELRAWRAAWKRGEAERWLATTAIPGVPRERQTEHHAPTAELCTSLVQQALCTPLSWVVEAPHKVEADPMLKEWPKLIPFAELPGRIAQLEGLMKFGALFEAVADGGPLDEHHKFINDYVESHLVDPIYPPQVLKLCEEAAALWAKRKDPK